MPSTCILLMAENGAHALISSRFACVGAGAAAFDTSERPGDHLRFGVHESIANVAAETTKSAHVHLRGQRTDVPCIPRPEVSTEPFIRLIIPSNVNGQRLFSLKPKFLVACAIALASICLASLPAHEASAQDARVRPWLGIHMDASINADGVGVKSVLRKSPAEAAGIRPMDRILRIDGIPVTRAGDIVALLARKGPGGELSLHIARNGKTSEIRTRLERAPSGETLLRNEYVGLGSKELTGLASVRGAKVPALADLQGHVVVLHFWASWCGACRMTIPFLNAWHGRYGSNGLAVVGIAGEPRAVVEQESAELMLRYTTAADPEMSSSETYSIREIPALFVIDKRGIVRDVATGFDPLRLREIQSHLETLLEESP